MLGEPKGRVEATHKEQLCGTQRETEESHYETTVTDALQAK